MHYLKKLILFNLIFIFFSKFAYAEQSLKFANIDLIIKKTNIGNKALIKIDQADKSNIQKLNEFEKELKEKENEIKQKKNLISTEEFNNEINILKKKIVDFNKQKNLMVKELSDLKKNELKLVFEKINPIIQDYMKKNSIEILINSKNVYIGSKKSDITQQLIDDINSKIKNND